MLEFAISYSHAIPYETDFLMKDIHGLMNDRELAGRRVLITAASSGIGFAIASVLAEKGAAVFMTSGSSKIEKASEKLLKKGLRVYPLVYDMTSDEPVSVVEKASKSMGGIDTLVVNYGDPTLAPFMELGDEDWDRYIRMFIKATIGLVRESVKIMGTGGRVVFITSMTTREAYQGFAISGSLRAAVVNLGKILSLELGPRGITVNSVSQGYFLTERLSAVIERNARLNGTSIDEEKKNIISTIPAGRFGEPAEIGHLVSFLCSPEASYITGANIPIDGGLTRYPY